MQPKSKGGKKGGKAGGKKRKNGWGGSSDESDDDDFDDDDSEDVSRGPLVLCIKLIAFELAGEDRNRRENPVLSRLEIAFFALHKRG